MKIAFVCPRYYPYIGGVENYVRQIARRLCLKHEVEVLTTDPSRRLPLKEEIGGVHVMRFKAFAPGEAYHFSFSMKRYLKRCSRKYDIVHANSYHDLPAYYASLGKSTNKLIFTPHFHGTIGHTFFRTLLHIPYKRLGRTIIEKSDKILCCTLFEKKRLLSAFHIPESKLQQIQEGISCFSSKRKLGHNFKVILYISRLEKYKGIQHIIRALNRLPNDVCLHIVGKGPYKQTLVREAKKVSVQNRIHWLQDLTEDELSEAYANANVAVLLSKHEQYGYFIGEALASGLPCVVAESGALSEWVDGVNCIGVNDPSDSEEVANAICTMMGRVVSDVRLPTWDDYVEKLQRLYQSMVSWVEMNWWNPALSPYQSIKQHEI